jgi:hypothetical protein
MERHRDIVLGMDIMFVNGIPFLLTTSRYLRFITVEALQKCRKAKTPVAGIKKVCTIYGGRGFRVRTADADNEFEPLRADLYELGIHDLNIVSVDPNPT